MTAPRVLALDVSTRNTGIALPDGTGHTLDAGEIKKADLTAQLRIARVSRAFLHIAGIIRDHAPDVIAIEGYSHGSGYQAHQQGEIGGTLRVWIQGRGYPWLEVSPSSIKRYAIGKGSGPGTDKTAMALALLERAGVRLPDEHQVDAHWLRALVLDAYSHPLYQMPQKHREAIDALTLPPLEVPVDA